LLVIIGLALLWYGLAPTAGALFKRYKWFKFRGRVNELRLRPIMDNRAYWRQETSNEADPCVFRFIGDFEAVTDDQILWVRSADLLVPVFLKNAETYLLPMQRGEGAPEASDPGEEAPEKIRPERISAIADGARVFVGGRLTQRDGRWGFVSAKESPLTVIFYDGPDHSLATKAIWAGRQQGEYFNPVTPYALIIGAVCLLSIAAFYLPRPAFRPAVIMSIIATFLPLFPLVPPGLLFTVAYRRLTRKSRILRAYSDLAKLPLRHFAEENAATAYGDLAAPLSGKRVLPDGQPYGFVRSARLPPEAQEGKIPVLIPEITELKAGENWYTFGAIRPSELLPFRPRDPFATFGVLPGNPRELSRRFTAKAYALEAVAWLMLMSGIALNLFFLGMILPVLV